MSDKLFVLGNSPPGVYDDTKTPNQETAISYSPGAGKIAFVDGAPATITDSDSGFVTAGFVAGDIIKVIDSDNNDGWYQVDTVAAGTLTLHSRHSLTAGTPTGTVYIKTKAMAAVQGGELDVYSIVLHDGATIDEFSTDSDMDDSSDTAVPTEAAVREYVQRVQFMNVGGY